MKFLKKLIFITFITSLFWAGQSFAESDPTIETLSASGITHQVAVLNAEFDSQDNNYFPTEQPVVWFEYGTSRNDLDDETVKLAKIKGNYIVSQGIINLEEDTKYWYRPVIRFDSDNDYGEKLSFITDVFEEEVVEVVNNTSTTSGNYLSPDELLQQYYDGTSNTQSNTTTTNEQEENQIVRPEKQLSFFEFIRQKLFGKDGDTEEQIDDENLVYSEEEIAELEKEKQERLEKLSEQKKYNNSAAHDDELGEIVEYNTNYQNKYKNTSYDNQHKRTSGNTLNYPLLFLLTILLLVGIFLIHMVIRTKRKKLDHIRQNQPSGQGRYHIPVRRNPQNPVEKTNPPFRNPPQK